MSWILIIVLAALVAAVSRRKSLGPSANLVIGILAGLALALVIFRAVSHEAPRTRATRVEQAFSYACGFVLAEQVAAAVEPGPVIVLQHPRSILDKAGREAELDGVREGLGDGNWSLKDVAVDLGDASMVEAVVSGAAPHPLNAQKIMDYLEQEPGAVAFISFIGLPHASPASLKGKVPPFFVAETAHTQFDEWWRSGLLGAVAKLELSPQREDPDLKAPPGELFGHRFLLLTKMPRP
jgi:hypothetical protein